MFCKEMAYLLQLLNISAAPRVNTLHLAPRLFFDMADFVERALVVRESDGTAFAAKSTGAA